MCCVISVPCHKVWNRSRRQLCQPGLWPACLEQKIQMPQVSRQLFSSYLPLSLTLISPTWPCQQGAFDGNHGHCVFDWVGGESRGGGGGRGVTSDSQHETACHWPLDSTQTQTDSFMGDLRLDTLCHYAACQHATGHWTAHTDTDWWLYGWPQTGHLVPLRCLPFGSTHSHRVMDVWVTSDWKACDS